MTLANNAWNLVGIKTFGEITTFKLISSAGNNPWTALFSCATPIMKNTAPIAPQMAAHYTKAARRKALSTAAAKKLEEGESTIVKLKV